MHVDGALTDSLNWPYHKIDQTKTTCILGCLSNSNLSIKIPAASTTLNPMSSVIPGLPNTASTSLSAINEHRDGFETTTTDARRSAFGFYSPAPTSLAASSVALQFTASPVTTPKVSPNSTPMKQPTQLPSVSQVLHSSPFSTSPATLPYAEGSSASASVSSLHLPSSLVPTGHVPPLPTLLPTTAASSQVLPKGTAPTFSYAISSAVLLSIPVPNVLPRLIHHLGPRYMGLLQDKKLSRFLTYGSATSLSIWLFSLGTQGMQLESTGRAAHGTGSRKTHKPVKSPGSRRDSVAVKGFTVGQDSSLPTPSSKPAPIRRMTLADLTSAFTSIPSVSITPTVSDNGVTMSPAALAARARKYEAERKDLVKLLREGTGVSEDNVLFYVSSGVVEHVARRKGGEVEDILLGLEENPENIGLRGSNDLGKKDNWDNLMFHGDIVTYRPQCLDVGVWEIGGAGILLRIVEIANVSIMIAARLVMGSFTFISLIPFHFCDFPYLINRLREPSVAR